MFYNLKIVVVHVVVEPGAETIHKTGVGSWTKGKADFSAPAVGGEGKVTITFASAGHALKGAEGEGSGGDRFLRQGPSLLTG